jgi:hypothetical protein
VVGFAPTPKLACCGRWLAILSSTSIYQKLTHQLTYVAIIGRFRLTEIFVLTLHRLVDR